MNKRVFGSLAASFVIAGLLVVGTITPVAAQAPFGITNFHPTDDPDAQSPQPIDGTTVLSDRNDGVNSTAHLTAVATTDTDRVQWYVCSLGVVGSTVNTQAELTQCGSPIGTDATASRPGSGSSGAATDEAYEAEWNIPADLDGARVDIASLACTGAVGSGTRVESSGGSAANCVSDVEQDISLEDAQSHQGATTGQQQTSSGEIVSLCTADVDQGPSVGNNPCQLAGPGEGTDAEVAARFGTFPHGSSVPNDGFVFRVSTDPTSTDVAFRLMGSSDASGISAATQTAGPFISCIAISVTVSSILHECAVTDAQMGAVENRELDLQLTDFTDASGAGYCDPTDGTSDPDGTDEALCQYDAHYVVSGPRGSTTTSSTTFSFQPSSRQTGTNDGSPGANAGCDAGETIDASEEQPLQSEIWGTLCLLDQFGNPLSGVNVTFEGTGGGPGAGIAGCAPGETAIPALGAGDLHDEHGATTTNNQRFDDCHTTTDSDGEASVRLTNHSSGGTITATSGTQVITGCIESEYLAPASGGNQTNQPAEHGCSDEASSSRATGTVNWRGVPDHIHLVIAGTGGDDPCHNGEKFRSAVVGQDVELLVCTQVGSGAATHFGATTNQAGGGRVTYSVSGASGGQTQIATRLLNQPTETDGAGRATLRANCFEEGTDNISATLRDDTDALVGNPSTLQVTCVRSSQPTTTSPSTTTGSPSSPPVLTSRTVSLEASKARVTFGRDFTLSGGISSADQACVGAQPVTIRRTVVGQTQQEIVDTLTTNSDGTFSQSFRGDRSAQYIASLGATATCGAASSMPAPVNVKMKVDLRVSDQRIRRGQRVRLTADFLPCDDNHVNTPVVFFNAVGGVFSKFASRSGGSNCSATITVRPRRDTAYQARYSSRDEDHNNGKSRKKAVSVRR